MKVYGIILAGGPGSRMKMDTPKQFLTLKDKPIIAWSMEVFESCEFVDSIIVVTPTEYFETIKEITDKYNITKFIKAVKGGGTRQESSLNAINSIKFKDDDILLLHDAARPFVTKSIVEESIKITKKYGASAVYVPAIDTITEMENNSVKNIPNRDNLYYAQTPQSFRFDIINEAHKNHSSSASDDVSLVLNNAIKVHKVKGNYSNIKITTEYDYKIANLLYRNE